MPSNTVCPLMLSSPIAMPPPGQFYAGLAIGLTVAIASLAAFLGRNRDFGWRRLLGLCVLAFALGPLAGAGIAVFAVVFGDVHPLDRWWLITSLAIVGTVAGAIVTALMGIIGTIQIMGRGCVCQRKYGGTPESPPGGSRSGGVAD
jgi:MFS family permease